MVLWLLLLSSCGELAQSTLIAKAIGSGLDPSSQSPKITTVVAQAFWLIKKSSDVITQQLDRVNERLLDRNSYPVFWLRGCGETIPCEVLY